MLYRLRPLGRAEQSASTSSDCLILFSSNCGTAYRTFRWQPDTTSVLQSSFNDHANNFRYDVSRTSDDDRIADPNILAMQFVNIVQGRIADRDAADEHGPQARHRRKRARPAYPNLYAGNLGYLFLRP